MTEKSHFKDYGKKKKKKCLRCKRRFKSEGIHNRVCEACKVSDKNAWYWDSKYGRIE